MSFAKKGDEPIRKLQEIDVVNRRRFVQRLEGVTWMEMVVRKIQLLSVVVATFLAAACASVPPLASRDEGSAAADLLDLNHENGRVMVVAHRACWADGAPENSLSAIDACLAMGVDMIEIDVKLTQDGMPIDFHDSTLDRTTNGSGPVSEHSLAQIKSLNLKSGDGRGEASLTTERVPTLAEALERIDGKLLVNLDVKGDYFSPAFEVVDTIGVKDQILMKMAAAPDSPVLVGADFRGKTLFMPIVRECTPRDLDRNCTPTLSAYIPRYEVYEPVAYEISFSTYAFFEEGVATMTREGGRIWVNTLSPRHAAGIIDDEAVKDPDSTWGVLIDAGANMIQTDRPRELITYLKSRT